jgi:hypothetical protein
MMLKWLKRRRGARKGYVSFGTALSEIEAALSRAKADSAQSNQGSRREIPETSTYDKGHPVARAARIETPGERAWKMLRELLLEGTLPSYIESATGTMVPIHHDFWVGNGSIELREVRRRSKGSLEYNISGQVVMPEEALAKLVEHATQHKKKCRVPRQAFAVVALPRNMTARAF